MFGFDIYKHGINTMAINKNELDFIIIIQKINVLIQVKEFDQAKNVIQS